jgi:hypothetical protein
MTMLRAVANSVWLAGCLPEYRRFCRAVDHVRKEQKAILFGILRANARTGFGRKHEFSQMRTIRDYQERVRLHGYEDFRVWIDRMADGEQSVLTGESVRLFEPTSGSASATKLIPYTASLQRQFRRAIRSWVADLFLHSPALLNGSAYWSVSPPVTSMQETRGGIPVGFADDSAYVGGFQQKLVEAVLAVPSTVRRIRDAEEFWYLTLRHLVGRRDLRLISVWNPSFLMLLVNRLPEWEDSLARDLKRAGLLENAVRLRAAVRANTVAERHVRLWPNLRMISCWADGNSAAAAQKLARLFPHSQIRGKGLIATEGFVSFPLTGYEASILAVRSHFLEFLAVDTDGQIDDTKPQLAHELEIGQRYSVVLTTGGGLYRYRLGDLVEVTGRWKQCPLVRFAGRGDNVSDWCGEKLNEAHVAKVLATVFRELGVSASFAMLSYDAGNSSPRYVLYLETDASAEKLFQIAAYVEHGLLENFHYRHARDLGQLQRLRMFRAQDADFAYLSACVDRGQRAGDVKPLALDPRGGWTEKFRGHFVEEPAN